MRELYMLMGAPGSGKTTFAKEQIKHLPNAVHISRDEIRFGLVNENEEYFSKEKEVFNIFIDRISDSLADGKDVFADATHLSRASRAKLLNALKVIPSEVHVIWVKTTLETALDQNENRKGTRAYVPRDVIGRMYKSIQVPEYREGIDEIYLFVDGKFEIMK